MDPQRRIVLVERLAWVLIFGGLLALVLGLAAADTITAWTLVACGAAAALGGIVLIWLRSRLQESPAPPADFAAATPARRRASHNEP